MSTERALPSRDEVFQAVQAIVADRQGVPLDSVTEEVHLTNDLGCDSLTVIEITMGIEETFDIMVPDDSSDELLVVAALVDGVLELLDGKPVAQGWTQ